MFGFWTLNRADAGAAKPFFRSDKGVFDQTAAQHHSRSVRMKSDHLFCRSFHGKVKKVGEDDDMPGSRASSW